MPDKEKKLQIHMTEKEYYEAVKFKNKTLARVRINGWIIILILLVALAIYAGIIKNYSILTLATIFAIFIFLFLFVRRRAEISSYSISPVLNSPQLIIFDEDFELVNNYEKIRCPKFNVFASGQTDSYLFVIATPRKGWICIDKKRYSSTELDALIAALKNTKTYKDKL